MRRIRVLLSTAMMGLSAICPCGPGLTHYVAAGNTGAIAPYTNRATAAAVLQDAVDVAAPGALILVDDGVYDTGGRVISGPTGNRVAITNPVTVRSLNGPERTMIVGGGSLVSNPVRCVCLASNAVLSGFTLTNGHTAAAGDAFSDMSGGGAWCGPDVIISNCHFIGNVAYLHGGAAYGGSLRSCRLTGNRAEAGSGGGAYGSTLCNGAVYWNSAHTGGGLSGGTAIHCTVVGNVAFDMLLPHVGVEEGRGGGTLNSVLANDIVYFNAATLDPNVAGGSGSTSNTCTTPDPGGIGNITADPLLARNFYPTPDSPCIDAAAAPGPARDARGIVRPIDGNHDGVARPDMGAFEYRPFRSSDVDNDGVSDIACYHPPTGTWFAFGSVAGFWQTQFGFAGTYPVTGEFDGDGLTDIGCYNPSAGQWYLYQSADGFKSTQFGFRGTLPVAADFDRDGLTDIGCYDPPSGRWYVFQSTAGFMSTQFGFAGTWPVTGDFDDDGAADIGCYDPGTGRWYFFTSGGGFSTTQFGFAGTFPATGDYDGDGRSDIACYHPPTGQWYMFRSLAGFGGTQFGFPGTLPVH